MVGLKLAIKFMYLISLAKALAFKLILTGDFMYLITLTLLMLYIDIENILPKKVSLYLFKTFAFVNFTSVVK
jgi:hypothetical protein